MFYYLIHNLPWGEQLQPGKRNVRTFITGSVCYILIHALLFASKANFHPMATTIIYAIRKYFWWIVMADAMAMAITYKLAYGRNILTEIPIFEMIGEWIGGTRETQPPQNNIQPHPQQLQANLPLIDKSQQMDKTQANVPINSVKNTTIEPNKDDKTQNDELDIDLLTENESQPDDQTIKVLVDKNIKLDKTITKSDKLDTEHEKDIIEPDEAVIDSVNVDEEIDPENENKETQSLPVESPQKPKLTSENLSKYVINRSKLKIPAPEIKSEDLNL